VRKAGFDRFEALVIIQHFFKYTFYEFRAEHVRVALIRRNKIILNGAAKPGGQEKGGGLPGDFLANGH